MTGYEFGQLLRGILHFAYFALVGYVLFSIAHNTAIIANSLAVLVQIAAFR